MKNKIFNSILNYGFIIFIIILLIDCIIKKHILISIFLIIDIIIFLPLTKKIFINKIGKDKDWIIYVLRIIITVLIIILISLTNKVDFYNTYISEDKKTTIIIDKYNITILKDSNEDVYTYGYTLSDNREEYFIEVNPPKTIEHQFMLFRYNKESQELCKLEDGACIEDYRIKK